MIIPGVELDIWQASWIVALAIIVYTVFWALVWEKPVWSPPASTRARARSKKLPTYEGLPSVVAVTGGRGFLGRHIVEALVTAGIDRVVVFDLPARDKRANEWIHELNASSKSKTRVELVEGDLTQETDLNRAFRHADSVIHCASPHPQHASAELLEAVVVKGTRQILAACDRLGVGSIVLTSSASVVFSGLDQFGVDETLSIPSTFRDDYSRCKAQSELDVLAAGKLAATSGAGVRAVAVRPHGIFGPRDAQMVPGVCEVSSTWRGRLILGDGANMVDFTYVGNVVHGHLMALEKVHQEVITCSAGGVDGSVVSGRSFFITNDEPIAFWEFIGRVKAGLAYPAGFVRIPYRLALTIAQLQETVAHVIASLSGNKAKALHLSPQRVSIAGTAHWYSCDAAKTALGYAPVWDLDEALALTIDAYPHLRYDGIDAVISPLDDADADAHLSDGPQHAYTMEQVAEHSTEGNCWIVVDENVYDVTQYLGTHPGGMKSLLKHAGGDATRGFHGDQHPDDAGLTLQDFRIGWVSHE